MASSPSGCACRRRARPPQAARHERRRQQRHRATERRLHRSGPPARLDLGFERCPRRPGGPATPSGSTEQVDGAGDGDAEGGAADDVERVVGADVDPPDHHAEHEQPRHDPPPAGEVGRDDAGQRGDEHGVTGHEALAGEVDVAAELDVGADRRAGTLAADERLHHPFGDQLEHGDGEGGDGEAVAAAGPGRRPRRSARRSSAPSCWNGQHGGYSALRQVVERPEHALLDAGTVPSRTTSMPSAEDGQPADDGDGVDVQVGARDVDRTDRSALPDADMAAILPEAADVAPTWASVRRQRGGARGD